MQEQNSYITPSLPRVAIAEMKAWEAQQKKPVFIRVAPQARNGCSNCAGLGTISVIFTDTGPLKNPPNSASRPATWFDGSPLWSPGWYMAAVETVGNRTQSKTKAYACPTCEGRG